MAREPAHVLELRRALGQCLSACRQEAGWTQRKLGNELNYHPTAISHLEAGRHPAPREFWKRADELLAAEGVLIAGYEALVAAKQDAANQAAEATRRPDTQPAALPAHGGTSGRRTALKLSVAAALAPEVLRRVLADSAAEAMEFTRLAGVSSVGHGTLEHLELVITDLSRGYSHEPPAEQFAVARAYRARVDELIRGRHTLKELRELYVHAGCLSELLAYLAHDLGNPRTAQAYAVDCYVHGEQAGHGELCGWAADVMTTITTYAESPHRAVQAGMKGITQVPAGHPLAIRLRAKTSRAYAQLGDRETFATLFAEARNLHDQMPTQTPRRFTLDTGRMASYAIAAHPAQAYLWLDDFHAAKTHSEVALAVHESAPPGGSSPGKGSIARLDLAIALAHLGSPDEAAALGGQALTSTSALGSVLTHARDLNAALVSRYPTLTCVRDFHEQYRQIARRPTRNAD
ncbi:MAG: helix-turn-helix domain-containing protein [Pseudonocardiaceae bacterium]